MKPSTDLLRQLLNVVLAITQWLVGLGSLLIPWGTDMATRSAENPSPLTPPGWAFSIWGLIYLACALYAAWQALPHNRENPILRAAGWWSAAAFALCALWIPVNQFGPYPLTFPVLIALAACAWKAFRAVNCVRGKVWQQRYFIQMPLGLFAGWVTLAAFVNGASLYTSLHLAHLLSLNAWAGAFTLAAGFAAALLVRRSRGNIWFAFPILWGLFADAIGNFCYAPANHPAAALASVALLMVGTSVLLANLKPTAAPLAAPV